VIVFVTSLAAPPFRFFIVKKKSFSSVRELENCPIQGDPIELQDESYFIHHKSEAS